jgi:hypothetical protein
MHLRYSASGLPHIQLRRLSASHAIIA